MLVRIIKNLVPKPLKHYVARQMPNSKVSVQIRHETEQALIKAKVDNEISNQIFNFVPRVLATTVVEEPIDSLISKQSAQGNGSHQDVIIKNQTDLRLNPIFKDFLGQYEELLRNDNQAKLEQIRQDYPVSAAMGDQLSNYFKLCTQVESPIANTMKRIAYTVVPFYSSPKAIGLYSYKETLPKIGLLSHPNSQPRDFIIDALNGVAAAEDIEPSMIVSNTWAQRPYDYLCALREHISEQIAHLPSEFFQKFPSKDWFIEQLTYNAQCEIGLQQLLEQKRWKAAVVGDATSPLCLAMIDTPREKRPPIIYYAHGVSYGHPISTMFMKADYVFARGKRDEDFMIDLGFPKANILRVGSPSHEGYPSNEILAEQRKQARLRCGVIDDTPIIVFGVTWDPYFYKARPAHEIQALLIEAFTLVAQKYKGKNPILYLKYHPHPVNDPSYNTSRLQYPLDQFLKLREHGYTIRLAKTFDDCMPAADCFMGHESSVLCDAVAQGQPTVSLDYATPKGRPTLNYSSYDEPSTHKIQSVYDNADTIADAIVTLIQKPRTEVWDSCRKAWHNVFDCGRSEGLARITHFLRNTLEL